MVSSQVDSGYSMSYLHICIHKDMYLGHLESLFTIYDCTLSDRGELIVLV